MAAVEHVLILALAFLTFANAESPCTYYLGTLICEDRNLTTVPTGLPSDAETLDLRGNHIKSLLPDNFVRYSKLSKLFLSGNGLEAIHPDAFTGLTKLKSLTLSDNLLRTFPCHALQNLPALRNLKLDNNTINWIPPNCTLPSLKGLDLSNNRLKSLPCNDLQNCFLSLDTMTNLNLKNNQLQTLPEASCSFGEPTKLTLDGNPWRCDDSLLPLLPCNQVSSRVRCAMPLNVSGAILSSLSPNQLVRRADVNVTITGRSTVFVGESASFWCNVQDTSVANFTWGKIQKADRNTFYQEGQNILLTDVTMADAGVYICEVSIGDTKAWENVRLEVLAIQKPSTSLPTIVQSSKATTKVTTAVPATTTGKNETSSTSMPVGNITLPESLTEEPDVLGWQLIVIIFAAVFIALIVACLVLTAWRKLGWGNVDSLPQYEGPIPIVVVDSPRDNSNGEVFFVDEERKYGSAQSLVSHESYGKHNRNVDDELSDEVDHPGSQGISGATRSIQDERYPISRLEEEREQLIDQRHSKGGRTVESLRSGASSRTSINSRPRKPRREEHSSRERVQKRRRSRDNGDNVSASTQSSLQSTRSGRSSRHSRRRQRPAHLVPDVIVRDDEEEDGIDGQSQVGTKKTIASERDLWKRWNPQRHSTSRRDVKSRAGGRAIATGRGAETFDLGTATPPEQAMNDSFELQDFSRASPKRQSSQRSLADGKRSPRRPRRGREDVDSGKGSSKEI
ncbi:leucine-rich repeat-containing protein 24-like [Branchiostoma lanceolatum]|uniref:leucine-rich repeat-containing protein 24-like n=1 Tax=Branchiostoma lanceolatum TaxID=7740 RepID=UPI0034526137